MNEKLKIGSVVVTYNRLDCLKKTLPLYEKQKKLPEYIIVVDNCSSDGTKEYLKEWEKETGSGVRHFVIFLNENTGGSGGFYHGLDMAKDLNADWITLADDDAFLDENNFFEFQNLLEKYPELVSCSAIWSNVCFHNDEGKEVSFGVYKIGSKLFGCRDIVFPLPQDKDYVEVELLAFLGAFINKKAVNSVGLPCKDFFIYHDDFEYSLRLKKYGKIICCSKMKLYHTVNATKKGRGADWRDYYITRNILIVNKKYFGKMAFFSRTITRMISVLFQPDRYARLHIILDAISDAKKGITGMHKLYKPGWSSNVGWK